MKETLLSLWDRGFTSVRLAFYCWGKGVHFPPVTSLKKLYRYLPKRHFPSKGICKWHFLHWFSTNQHLSQRDLCMCRGLNLDIKQIRSANPLRQSSTGHDISHDLQLLTDRSICQDRPKTCDISLDQTFKVWQTDMAAMSCCRAGPTRVSKALDSASSLLCTGSLHTWMSSIRTVKVLLRQK